MSASTSTTSLPPPLFVSIWWVFLLQGIPAVILGQMFLGAPGGTLLPTVALLGIYWIVTGALALARILTDRSLPWIWSFIVGIVGTLAAIFVLGHPVLATLAVPTVLVIVLGVQGLVLGVYEIVGEFKSGGIGLLVVGLLNVAVGLSLVCSAIMTALAVPFVSGVLLLSQGAALVVGASRDTDAKLRYAQLKSRFAGAAIKHCYCR